MMATTSSSDNRLKQRRVSPRTSNATSNSTAGIVRSGPLSAATAAETADAAVIGKLRKVECEEHIDMADLLRFAGAA